MYGKHLYIGILKAMTVRMHIWIFTLHSFTYLITLFNCAFLDALRELMLNVQPQATTTRICHPSKLSLPQKGHKPLWKNTMSNNKVGGGSWRPHLWRATQSPKTAAPRKKNVEKWFGPDSQDIDLEARLDCFIKPGEPAEDETVLHEGLQVTGTIGHLQSNRYQSCIQET